MIQTPPVQIPQQYIPAQPNYNAVKIDINNPQVNTPGSYSCPQTPPPVPVYQSIPTVPVYEMPKQSIYAPQQNFNQPAAIQEMPAVPAPVVVPPSAVAEIKEEEIPAAAPVIVAPEPVVVPAAPVPTPAVTAPVEASVAAPVEPLVQAVPVEVPAQKVEVQAPEQIKPQVDINEFIKNLTNPDFEVQANAMESIADLAQNQPQKATELLDVKVIDTLLGIMQSDSSKLEGPTAQQLQIREKIMSGKPVTEVETAEANKITPMEQAERNKQYSIYTVAILQKLYGSEIEKMSNSVVPLTELPGAAGVVEQIKANPNPMVRAAGIDALSYVQRPEYKQDLTTLFSIAQKDKDVNVQQAATKALEKLAQVPNPVVAEQPVKTEEVTA